MNKVGQKMTKPRRLGSSGDASEDNDNDSDSDDDSDQDSDSEC